MADARLAWVLELRQARPFNPRAPSQGKTQMLENKRWKKRPENSTWGDYGPDDQLGRLNELTPAKVKEGVAEVKEGKTFCLSLPLDYPGGNLLNPRRHPRSCAHAARRQAELALPHRLGQAGHDGCGQRRCRGPAPAVFDAVGHAGPRRCPVRCQRYGHTRAHVLQRLPRRHRPGRTDRGQGVRRRPRHLRRGQGDVVRQGARRRKHGRQMPCRAAAS